MIDLTLILKLSLVPALISLASLAGNRWGPGVSGWLVSLPLTSGPVIFILALEQGTLFASKASGGVILGLASIAVFALVYSWISLRLHGKSWFYSLLPGWGAFFLLTYLMIGVTAPPVVLFLGVAVFMAIVVMLLPRQSATVSSNQSATKRVILVRIVAATALVLIITGVANVLGPQLSGLLTPFPVYVSVLVASEHRLQGASFGVQLVRGVTAGLFTPAVFCLVVGSTIVRLGLGISFGLAIAASLPVHAISFAILRRQNDSQGDLRNS